MTPTFWEHTKKSAQKATREYFAPLMHSSRSVVAAPVSQPAPKMADSTAEDLEDLLSKPYKSVDFKDYLANLNKGPARVVAVDGIEILDPKDVEHDKPISTLFGYATIHTPERERVEHGTTQSKFRSKEVFKGP